VKATRNFELNTGQFHTERDYDKLTVNGVEYHGEGNNYGPSGVAMYTGNQMSWRSDGSVTRDGFKVCASLDNAPLDIGF